MTWVPKRLDFEVRRILAQGRKVLLKIRLGEHWDEGGAFEQRHYPDYETYIKHQQTKYASQRLVTIQGHDERFHAALTERLNDIPVALKGRSVLCLAARQGSEVRAFIDHGAFSVGIDLNPGQENRWVVVGDFHALQYADDSVDIVYTNSLDHAFDLERITGEVKRVLRADGAFIVELNMDDGGGSPRGFYESFSWVDVDQMKDRLVAAGFELQERSDFEVPWLGTRLVLRPVEGGRERAQEAPGT